MTSRGIGYVEKKIPEFLSALNLECRIIETEIEEVTLKGLISLLELSREYRFCSKSDLLESLGFENMAYHGGDLGIPFYETILDGKATKDDLIQKAQKLLCCGSLVPELERIYSPAKRKQMLGKMGKCGQERRKIQKKSAA